MVIIQELWPLRGGGDHEAKGTLDRRGFLIGYGKLARRAGLEVGDRVLFVNGQPVNSIGGLVRIYRQLRSESALSEVKVVINRNNQLQTLTYRIR